MPTVLSFLAGGIAGATSVLGKVKVIFYFLVNNPIDVVKTQMQGLEAHKYKNSLDCLITQYKSEGIRGFYKGLVPRLSRVILDVAMTFTLYEKFSSLIDNLIKK